MLFAIVRPDSWNLPLFVHVAGAMLLVGMLVVTLALSAGAVRRGEGAAALARLSFRTLLLGVLPAYVVMRAGAEWVASEEAVGDPTWVGIGYATADGGLLLTLIAIGLAWRASRRGVDGAGGMGRAVMVLAAVVIVAYGVALWAMTAKPS
jgi:hypothetical protein